MMIVKASADGILVFVNQFGRNVEIIPKTTDEEMKKLKEVSRMKKMIYLVVVLLTVFTTAAALALPVGTATLKWDPPMTNTDSTPLTDLSGYKLYYGNGSGAYTVTANIHCGILPCPGFTTNPPTDLERQQKTTSHPTIIAISGRRR